MAILGIDLGTSNTLVAKLNSSGDPEIVDIKDEKLVPSVFYFDDLDGNPNVGEYALEMWADPSHNPERSFRRWKLKMGEECLIRRLKIAGGKADDIEVTPEHLTTLMVEYLVRTISQGEDGEDVDAVLVTVPHGWRREKPEKCRATRIAASRARLDGRPVSVQELTVSEPVAAAAYWLWVASKKSKVDEFKGKTLMVCDVGGGTFDISLVQVGDISKPLDVVDAVNNEVAGDYTDALICGWVCGQFNTEFGTAYPEAPEELLELIESDQHHWLREWFLNVKKDLKEQLCLNIEAVTQRGKPPESAKSCKEDFRDMDGNHLQVVLSVQDFIDLLQPFYIEARKLVEEFLSKTSGRSSSMLPYALVFAGGGSRIHGLREHVILPALGKFFGSGQTVEEVVDRIETNLGKRDQVIAMGAALIANGVVSVQERLLHDIGMTTELDARFLAALNLPATTRKVLLSPLVPRGTCLPAHVTSKDLGLPPCKITGHEELDINVIIQDDSSDPWIQHWVLPNPAKGRESTVSWAVSADTDGALTMRIQTESGNTVSVEGRLERKRSGRASLCFKMSDECDNAFPAVTPQQLVQAFKKLGGAE